MKKMIWLLTFILGGMIHAWAQPDLPNVAFLSQGGVNVLSWINPHTSGVKEVAIERAIHADSTFTKIGIFKETNKPSQYFTDTNPMPGVNVYRVVVKYNSGLEWKCNTVEINVDSAEIADKSNVPTKDSINKLVEQLGGTTIESTPAMPQYTISTYVYTNPYNGNINIELENPLEINYSVIFYDDKNNKVLEVPRVNDDIVVLDKRNFQKHGIYQFKVFKGKEEFAKGAIGVY